MKEAAARARAAAARAAVARSSASRATAAVTSAARAGKKRAVPAAVMVRGVVRCSQRRTPIARTRRRSCQRNQPWRMSSTSSDLPPRTLCIQCRSKMVRSHSRCARCIRGRAGRSKRRQRRPSGYMSRGSTHRPSELGGRAVPAAAMVRGGVRCSPRRTPIARTRRRTCRRDRPCRMNSMSSDLTPSTLCTQCRSTMARSHSR